MSLTGKRCAVTGASSGVGAAIARTLAERGAAVVGYARRFAAEVLVTPPRPGELAEVRLDVTDEAAVAARFSELGALDVLVCAAGDGVFAPVAQLALADLRRMLDAHVVGTFACARAALPLMRAGGGGHLVAISSIAVRTAFPRNAGYAAAKAGQHALVRTLAEEVRADGVRCTNVVLGATDTPIWDDRPEIERGRMMRAADVAALVADVIARPELATEELVVVPPAGNL